MALVQAHVLHLMLQKLKGHIFKESFAGTLVNQMSFYIGMALA